MLIVIVLSVNEDKNKVFYFLCSKRWLGHHELLFSTITLVYLIIVLEHNSRKLCSITPRFSHKSFLFFTFLDFQIIQQIIKGLNRMILRCCTIIWYTRIYEYKFVVPLWQWQLPIPALYYLFSEFGPLSLKQISTSKHAVIQFLCHLTQKC